RRVAQHLCSEIGDVSALLDKLIARFRKQLAAAPIAAVLSRSFYGRPENLGLDYTGKTELAVYRERAFATRDGDAILAGNIDRLVVVSRDGRPIAADVLDFKTDKIAPGEKTALAAKAAFYRPQLAA